MAQQRKTSVRRESDLQPVYDVLDALQPDHLKAVYNSVDRRTRYIILMIIATAVLAWAMLTTVRLVSQQIASTTGPFLLDALKAPYSLDTRTLPVPADAQTTVLPAAFGDFARLDETMQVIIPATVSESSAADSTQPVAVFESLAAYPLAGCLAASTNTAVEASCVGLRSQYLTFADFQTHDSSRMNITAAQFASDAEAKQVMKALSRYAGSVGRVGNYALGVTTVDYFNSTVGGYHSFTWSHGVWVYTLSSPSLPLLEGGIKAFPY